MNTAPEKRQYDDIVSFVGTRACGRLTIQDILEEKTYEVWTISSEATVYDALTMMAEKEIGALLVVDGGRISGMLSERDYARKVILIGKTSKETKVREIMSTVVLHVTPTQTVSEAMALMTHRHVRHLPVIDGGELVGLVSIGDLVKSVISEQEHLINQFENYVRGVYPA